MSAEKAPVANAAGRLLQIAQEAVRLAKRYGADEAEAFVVRAAGASVALQKNDLHAAVSEDETTVGVRVLKGGARGFAAANDPKRLAETAAEAAAAARAAPPDPRDGFPAPSPIDPLADLADPALADVEAADLVDVACEMMDHARRLDRRVRIDSGGVSVERVERAVVNSRGVEGYEAHATAGGSLFGMAVDGDDVGSFDADGDVVRRAADLRTALRAAAERFVVKTTGALGARRGESFRGPVVFSPEATAEFVLGNLAAALSAKAVRVKRSPFGGRAGEQIADPRFTLVDDPRDPTLAGSAAFDREGVPTRKVVLVEGGVLKNFLYDTYEARTAGATSTGHARGGASSPPVVGVWNLSLAPGKTGLASLCATAERLVVVSRFSGSANAATGEFSGVVKGGYLVKDGVRSPVKEIQIAGNLYELLKRIGGISSETRLVDGSVRVPAVRFEDVSVTAG
jgi:PmbA protein